VLDEVGATRGTDGAKYNCMQPFGRKAVFVSGTVQQYAVHVGLSEYFVLLPVLQILVLTKR
jgi:hypothetical protein